MFTLIVHISISAAETNKTSGTGYDDSMAKQQMFYIWAKPFRPFQRESAPLPDFAATLMQTRSGSTEIHMLKCDGLCQREGDVK